MTTIAYKRGIMAADGLMCCDTAIVSTKAKKLWRLRDGSIVGTAGNYEIAGLLIAALEDKEAPWPDHSPNEDDWCSALIADPSGELFECSTGKNKNIHQLYTDIYALGSGSKFAKAAMELGASAEEAVILACRLDCASGGDIAVEAL